MAKVISLEVENIKGIKRAFIVPQDSTVIIEGENGQGKTSILDALWYALAGEKNIPNDVIREGEEKGITKIVTDEFEVERTYTKKGTYLRVKKDGMNAANAQSYLNGFLGNLTFDPLAFKLFDSKKRVEELRSLTGLDFTEIDRVYNEFYDQRRDHKREHDRLKKEIAGLAEIPTETKCRPVSEIQNELEDVRKQNQNIIDARKELRSLQEQSQRDEDEISDIEKQMKLLDQKKADLKRNIDSRKSKISLYDDIAQRTTKETGGYEAEIQAAEKNAEIRTLVHRKSELIELEQRAAQSVQGVQKLMDELKEKREKMIVEANMPIEGLSIQDNDVYFNGVSFTELAESEKIKVSMAIAMAQNPKLRIVRILDGALLDKKSFDVVKQMASENNFQVWVERAIWDNDSRTVGSILISEGEVVDESCES
jgi:DNA repair exonuclease SbcCD ATPase subunit